MDCGDLNLSIVQEYEICRFVSTVSQKGHGFEREEQYDASNSRNLNFGSRLRLIYNAR